MALPSAKGGVRGGTPGIERGSGEPHTDFVGTITVDQARQIAEKKMPDLNANDLDAATKIIAGTARSMGVDVEGL